MIHSHVAYDYKNVVAVQERAFFYYTMILRYQGSCEGFPCHYLTCAWSHFGVPLPSHQREKCVLFIIEMMPCIHFLNPLLQAR